MKSFKYFIISVCTLILFLSCESIDGKIESVRSNSVEDVDYYQDGQWVSSTLHGFAKAPIDKDRVNIKMRSKRLKTNVFAYEYSFYQVSKTWNAEILPGTVAVLNDGTKVEDLSQIGKNDVVDYYEFVVSIEVHKPCVFDLCFHKPKEHGNNKTCQSIHVSVEN